MRTLVVANDITPEFGLPVAAPGLRAWSLAEGLRAHGQDVVTVVNEHPLGKAAGGRVPPTAPGVVPMSMGRLDDYVSTHRPDAVVFTNSNHVRHLSPDHDVTIVYDFFAPKMLELGFADSEGGVDVRALAGLRARKIAALERSHIIALNGAKKRGYALAWLLQCDRDPATVPLVDVPFGVPAIAPEPHEGPLRLAVAGYIQRWSGASDLIEPLLVAMDEVDVEVHLLLARHWGGAQDDHDGGYERLLEHPHVVLHDPMPFPEFRRFLGTVDATIDLFDHHLEREYAMVTRTLVALCTGAAVIHPDHTEVADYVRRHDAGWLLGDGDDAAGELVALCRRLAEDRDEVATKRGNAARLAELELAPEAATAALAAAMERMRS